MAYLHLSTGMLSATIDASSFIFLVLGKLCVAMVRKCAFALNMYIADDNDGTDALFALAREKPREMADDVLIGIEPKKEKHYVRSLSCRGKKLDSDQQAMPPLTKGKK